MSKYRIAFQGIFIILPHHDEEKQGKEKKAFLADLSMPDTLHLAYQLTLDRPQEYLSVCACRH